MGCPQKEGWQGFHLLLRTYAWGGKGEDGGLQGGFRLLGLISSSPASPWARGGTQVGTARPRGPYASWVGV
ncbi:hypothetical protein DSO57_1000410 [Entomophthora muscae]|uniref:Uncharacterized protein n=1 Tax=Entomophthora muscae TaxID=34485 RepID=A0ACC2UI74_9FUNG|nr:hypothetical protein DSO57_1000410 [Entomophthora muscae]